MDEAWKKNIENEVEKLRAEVKANAKVKEKEAAADGEYNHKKAFKECTEEWNAKKAKDTKPAE